MNINLDDVITALEEEGNTYLCISSDELCYVEDDYIYFYGSNRVEDIDEFDSGDYLELPNRDYVNAYAMMEKFIDKECTGEAKEWLSNAIKGRGAFRMFRSVLDRFRIEDKWYKFREKELRETAISWCLENGYEYHDDYYEEEEEVISKSEAKPRLIQIVNNNKHTIVPLVIGYREYLSSLNGYKSNDDEMSANSEIDYYFKRNYPIYTVSVSGLTVGYAVYRIDDNVVWLESLFVKENYRNKGIGKMLFEKGEEIANECGNDTLYNNVHPNNDLMINFLNGVGYDVINLIEIRKPYKNEEFNEEYLIGHNSFRYKGKK